MHSYLSCWSPPSFGGDVIFINTKLTTVSVCRNGSWTKNLCLVHQFQFASHTNTLQLVTSFLSVDCIDSLMVDWTEPNESEVCWCQVSSLLPFASGIWDTPCMCLLCSTNLYEAEAKSVVSKHFAIEQVCDISRQSTLQPPILKWYRAFAQ